MKLVKVDEYYINPEEIELINTVKKEIRFNSGNTINYNSINFDKLGIKADVSAEDIEPKGLGI